MAYKEQPAVTHALKRITTQQELWSNISDEDLNILCNNIAWIDQWTTINVKGTEYYVPTIRLSSEQKQCINNIFERNGIEPIPFIEPRYRSFPWPDYDKDKDPFFNETFKARMFSDSYSATTQNAISKEFDKQRSKILDACYNLGLSKREMTRNLQIYLYRKAETFVQHHLNDPIRLSILHEQFALRKDPFWVPEGKEPHHQVLKSTEEPPLTGEWDLHPEAKAIREIHNDLAPKIKEFFQQIGISFTPPKLQIVQEKGNTLGRSFSRSGIVVMNIAKLNNDPDEWKATLIHEYVHEAFKDYKHDIIDYFAKQQPDLPEKDIADWCAKREKQKELHTERVGSQFLGSPKLFIEVRLRRMHQDLDETGKPRLKTIPEKITRETVLAAVEEIKQSYHGKLPKAEDVGARAGYPSDIERLEDLANLGFGLDEPCTMDKKPETHKVKIGGSKLQGKIKNTATMNEEKETPYRA